MKTNYVVYFSMVLWGALLLLALLVESAYATPAHHLSIFCGFVIGLHVGYFAFKCLNWVLGGLQ